MSPKLAASSPYHDQSDELVWNAFRNNNTEAFAVIYYRFFNTLLQQGLQISSDRELVKDCIHDLFLEIWKNKSRLTTPVSTRAYLTASIQRKILRQIKKNRSRKNESVKFPTDVVHCKEEQLILEQHSQDQKCMVGRALNSLSRRQKEAIQLKFYANLSYEEIAGMMKISTDSIYNLVSKAINSLHKDLTAETEPTLY